MNTLKTMGKQMKPIFVFALLEALLAGILIGCQTQGLDLDGDLRLILNYCFILFVALFLCLDRSDMETDPKKWRRGILAFIAVLVFGLLYDLRWIDNWISVRNLLSTVGTVSTLILLLIRFIRKRKLSVVTGTILLMASEGITALLLTFL